MNSNIPDATIEYLDNRISRYSMKMGKCEITNRFIYAYEVHCHHFKPKSLGGTDDFKNLRIIHFDVHRLIHATANKTIANYLNELKLDNEQMKKVNQYRKACNLEEISTEE
ncbi:HNH endonuclease signature motif containing protein [Peribacillus muralis]|uniref:HNH endonuclease signature motif containing protein n=1 Tax=Peribacillus muralis TaxID=264697 RepID=UPI003D0544CB